MNCFPSSLLWLVRVLYDVLLTAKCDVREVSAICIDLVFLRFICPALVTPEPHGICDAPISHISRFNLMQVSFWWLFSSKRKIEKKTLGLIVLTEGVMHKIDLDIDKGKSFIHFRPVTQSMLIARVYFCRGLLSTYVNPFSAKWFIIITTRRAPSLLGEAETF